MRQNFKNVQKDHRAEDDLGFEINFGAFQPEAAVSFLWSKFYEVVDIDLI